jgi:predicted amidophosphoribosyltransferase
MAVAIKPRKLRGPWADGYALDVHTTESVLVGHDAYGRAVFDTTRSPLGELLYRLKYRGDPDAVQEIADTVAAYLRSWRPSVEALVPVPPSNVARKRQPVLEIAKAVCASAGIPLCDTCITKTKSTPQLKNVYDLKRRIELLKGAFLVDRDRTNGRRLLLFDDLYRSGATASAITRLLQTEGAASAVYLLTLTWTRRTV